MSYLLAFVGRSFPRPVLDIGCGDADLGSEVGREAYVGIDPLVGISRHLRIEAGGSRFRVVRGVGEALPFGSGSFGTVFVRETLDHCLSPALLLLEAKRVLRPEGLLLVQQGIRLPPPVVPFRRSLRVALGRLKARLMGRQVVDARTTKMCSFDLEELESALSSQFGVDRVEVQGGIAYVKARLDRSAADPAAKDRR